MESVGLQAARDKLLEIEPWVSLYLITYELLQLV